jgi:cytochrome c
MYRVVLTVVDTKGSSQTDTVKIIAGNETPKIALDTESNTTFYSSKPFRYSVRISDSEDQPIDLQQAIVTLEYQSIPKTSAGTTVPLGLTLMNASDCKACHTLDKKSVGPSWMDVAKRYKGKNATEALANKIIVGGGGVWGTDHVMSAHPQIELDEAKTIVNYILEIADVQKKKVSIPLQGSFKFDQHNDAEPLGRYVLHASYSDKGRGTLASIKKTETITLRNPTQLTIYADTYSGFGRFGNWLTSGNHKSYYLFRDIDLTNITGFSYSYVAEKVDGEIEVRLDSYAGPVISTVKFVATGEETKEITGTMNSPVKGIHNLYFILIRRKKPQEEIANVKSITFNLK